MVPVAGGSHDGDMTHNNHSRIVRPRSGRMIAGVAAALARQFGVDVTLVRLAFVVSLFWSLPAREVDAWRKSDLGAWKAEVRALDPRIGFVLDRIESHEQVTFARYRDVQMSRWCDRGVVFIGDAAHATSPQLGQGANLALVDAWTLADCCSTKR